MTTPQATKTHKTMLIDAPNVRPVTSDVDHPWITRGSYLKSDAERSRA